MGKKNIYPYALPRIELRIIGYPGPTLVTAPTGLNWIPKKGRHGAYSSAAGTVLKNIN